MNFIDNFITKFHSTFIEKDRWMYLLDGLKTTLLITFFAVILGMVLGFLIAIIRSTQDIQKSQLSGLIMGRAESWDF